MIDVLRPFDNNWPLIADHRSSILDKQIKWVRMCAPHTSAGAFGMLIFHVDRRRRLKFDLTRLKFADVLAPRRCLRFCSNESRTFSALPVPVGSPDNSLCARGPLHSNTTLRLCFIGLVSYIGGRGPVTVFALHSQFPSWVFSRWLIGHDNMVRSLHLHFSVLFITWCVSI
jgi:hypothetical protein